MNQEPCPRCGSEDVSYHSSPCRCRRYDGHSCWSYPECERCGYTNGSSAANSAGNYWGDKGLFTSGQPLALGITPEVQARMDRYDRSQAADSVEGQP